VGGRRDSARRRPGALWLSGSFRPDEQTCVLRSYIRQRDPLIRDCAAHIQRKQKALTQMNVRLHKVISDITGATGMRILRPILDGERDPVQLAAMKARGFEPLAGR